MPKGTEDNVQRTHYLRDVDIEKDLISIDEPRLDLVIVKLKEVIDEHYEYDELCVRDD